MEGDAMGSERDEKRRRSSLHSVNWLDPELPGRGWGLDAIADLLEEGCLRFGRGRWRCTSELVDAVKLRVLARWMLPNERAMHWGNYALEILHNLVKKGPRKPGLDAKRTRYLADDEDLEAPPDGEAAADAPALPSPEELPPTLSPAELQVYTAFWNQRIIRPAAASLGMTPRDFRNRLQRAAAKIRRAREEETAERRPPPPLSE